MIKYWIWLSCALDAGSSHLKPLIEKFKSPDIVYKTPISELEKTYILSKRELEKLSDKSLITAESILASCKNSDINIVSFDDVRYPKSLKNIDNPPACLYIKGKISRFNEIPIICIVGTRKVSDYGKMTAWSLSARLAAGGITILSGGAIGVDTAAHEGAMSVGGKTIAVLPCGINYDYLKTNEFLRKTITDNGCLISEFPPDTPLFKNAFQIRNRLLSALALGVVIVEAAEKSGTMITARHALEQNKDIYVVTSRAGDKSFSGSNALLKDGATPLFSADDIFNEYINRFPNIIDINKAKKTNLSKLYKTLNSPRFYESDDGLDSQNITFKEEDKKIPKKIDETLPNYLKVVYNYIDKDVFTVDDVLLCGLSFEEVLTAVTELELYGYIKAIPGGRYSLIY